jgi:hypothetical protein
METQLPSSVAMLKMATDEGSCCFMSLSVASNGTPSIAWSTERAVDDAYAPKNEMNDRWQALVTTSVLVNGQSPRSWVPIPHQMRFEVALGLGYKFQ